MARTIGQEPLSKGLVHRQHRRRASAATMSSRYAGMRACTSTYEAPKTTPDCSVRSCGIWSQAPNASTSRSSGGEKGKVPACPGTGHDAAQRIEPQVAGSDVRAGDADSRQDDRRQRDAVEELQHRQPEQVEGDVASEDGVDLAEGHRVCRVEPRRPRRGGEETEQPGNRQRRKVDDRGMRPVSTVMMRGPSGVAIANSRRRSCRSDTRRFNHRMTNTAPPTRRPVVACADRDFRKTCS